MTGRCKRCEAMGVCSEAVGVGVFDRKVANLCRDCLNPMATPMANTAVDLLQLLDGMGAAGDWRLFIMVLAEARPENIATASLTISKAARRIRSKLIGGG